MLRALRLQLNSVGDIIPVDFPINLMITAAWYTATYRPNSIMVYNCTSGLQNPITWGQIRAQLVRSILKFPSSDIMWYPTTSVQYDEVTFNSTSCKQFADNFFVPTGFAQTGRLRQPHHSGVPARLLGTAHWQTTQDGTLFRLNSNSSACPIFYPTRNKFSSFDRRERGQHFLFCNTNDGS